jgi:plasmid stability protein
MHFDACPPVDALMPSLQIRDLPDDVYQAVAFRARQEHRSLAQQAVAELRRIPTLTAGERRRMVIARIRQTIQELKPPLTPSPEELVREDRER